MKRDVEVQNCGSIFLFHILTKEAEEWVNKNVHHHCMRYCSAIVVEPRYAPPLAAGMHESGLQVAI